MAGALPASLLVHTATPLSYGEDPAGAWVEGERGAGPTLTQGVPFACVLFMPSAGGQQDTSYRPRTVVRPTLMYNPARELADVTRGLVADGSPIVLSPESELLLAAPDLAAWIGGDNLRWEVDGQVQPFGPPGQVIGFQAALRRVED